MNRRKIALVGLVYALAIIAILAAVVVIAGLWPGAKTGQPAMAQVAGNMPTIGPGVPTIRPIWPAGGETAVRVTRTPSPAPTWPAPSATAEQPARQVALAATTAAPTVAATLTLATAIPATATPASTNTPSPVPPTRTGTPTAAVTPGPLPPGSISGQVLFKRATPARPLTVTLETAAYAVVASTRTAADGSFVFSHVADLPGGYNVVFSLDANPDLEPDREKYATWAWLGTVRVGKSEVRLPAFDIALVTRDQQPWRPISPAPDASFRSGETLQFEWPAFAENAQYWLDITRGRDLDAVWQSPLQLPTTASWSGTDTGEFWWAIGARWSVAPPYTFTIYSYFTRFVLAP